MENDSDSFSTPSLSGERPAKRRRTSQPTTHLAREVGLMRSSIPGDKFSSFVGSASGVYFIRSVYGAIRRSHPTASVQTRTPESDIVPGEDDHLPSAVPASSGSLWRDDEIVHGSTPTITFQDLVEWSSSYFANWHPAYPFLHAPATLEYFEMISRDGIPSQPDSENLDLVIVRSIMSISLADRRQDQVGKAIRYPVQLVFQSFDAAIDSLQKVLSRATSIQSLQAAISVQLFLVTMLRLNAASRLGGLIIRMALQLGLHRCPDRFPSFSIAERELRQRIFWSLYCIDRHVCQSMGLPLSLRDDDVDVCYPSGERHTPQQPAPDNRLRLLTLLVRHSEIRGQIMELRNKSIQHRQKETDQAVVITAKLAKWWNDVEEIIDSDEDGAPSVSAYHLTVLTILKHESIISLNRPILAAAQESSAYNAALQHCIGSSRCIITTLYQQGRNSSVSQSRLTLLWPSFTWAIWMSTFVLFHAANTKHVSQVMVSRLADKSLIVLQHLSRRGNVWPEACAAAIRDLRTHMMRPANQAIGAQDVSERSFADGLVHHSPKARTPGPAIDGTPNGHHVTQPRHPIGHPCRRTEPPSGSHRVDHSPASPMVPDAAFVCQGSTSAVPPAAAFSQRPATGDPNAFTPTNLPMAPERPASTTGILHWDDFIHNNGSFDATMPMADAPGNDPFNGFDIPFWLGQDHYTGMINEWS